MFTQINPSLADIFKITRKQFYVPITATITAFSAPVSGALVGSGNIQLPLGDVFLCNKIFTTAVSDTGTRYSPTATFDIVEANIQDASTGYSFTNGMLDLNALWQRGQEEEFFWGFWPQQTLNVTFQARAAAASGTAIATLPYDVAVILGGIRFSRQDFPQAYDEIAKMAGLNP